MKGPEALLNNVDVLKTSMGAFVPGVRAVFRGHDLHSEFKDMDWFELYIFGITGRRFSPEQVRFLHAIYVLTSYPDARIWNNRVAALAGSSRSTACLGVSAALAISEASIYGGGIYIPSTDFLLRTRKEIDRGGKLADCVLKELKARRGIAGYGRPIVASDERNEPLLEIARILGFDKGPHVQLAYAVEDFLLKGRWRLRMNYAGLLSAFAADLGLSARENYLFLYPVFLAGMLPCYIEASEKAEGVTFPVLCSSVSYEGVPKRTWSRHKQQQA